jgi:glycosyltransferase involved in cell wall biosynthesis
MAHVALDAARLRGEVLGDQKKSHPGEARLRSDVQRRSESSSGLRRRPLDVVLDGAIFGVSAVYPSQRAGIWRFLRDWTRELASREDVRLHLVSSGRAPWNELALEHALRSDPLLRELGHQWHPRSGVFASWRWFQSKAASLAFHHAAHRIRPTSLAGILKALQVGLGNGPRSLPTQGVFHSPYHALPPAGSALDGPGRLRSITVHDLIPVLHPEWFGDTAPFRKALASIGPRDLVFADSRSTRQDVLSNLPVRPEQVHVAYPGISRVFRPRNRSESRARLDGLGIPPVRFLLAVGTLEPRKNLPALLKAFARIAVLPGNEDLHLVLTGARGWKNQTFDSTLQDLGPLRSRVIATGFLSDEDLPLLYGACECFVFPSLYEGFGLPIAEAQACGAAVVCVDNSSQAEVAGEVSVLARDASEEAIASALDTLLRDQGALDRARAEGPANAARFGWKSCVDVHLEAWRCGMDLPT